MHQVKGQYPDYKTNSLKSNFYLNADQAFNPYTWAPPVHWTGSVGGKDVKFTQLNDYAVDNDSFDWGDFPAELDGARPYIIEAIDKAMRTMD